MGQQKRKATKEYLYNIEENIKDAKRDLTITGREIRIKYKKDKTKRNQKWYKYTCNKCGWTEGWIQEGDLNKNVGCGCCHGKVIVQEINSIWATNRWMYDLGVSEEDAKTYTPQSNSKIYVTCPDCGRIKNKPTTISDIYKRHSISCGCFDGITYPNKFLRQLIEQLKVNYLISDIEFEYSPKWINPKRYDGYFRYNNKEYIIEMDGGVGHGNEVYTNSKKSKEEVLEDDILKDNKAKEHGIEVIRINCNHTHKNDRFDFIKANIEDSKLNKLFDLTTINWNSCNEYSLRNLTKVACDYKRNNANLTVLEIGKLMNMGSTAITKYLKEGNAVGWCVYSPKHEKYKSIQRGLKSRKHKLIICIENGEIFNGAKDCQDKSEQIFGVKLIQGKVSEVCRNNRPHHHNFHFKYISDLTPEELIKYKIINEAI